MALISKSQGAYLWKTKAMTLFKYEHEEPDSSAREERERGPVSRSSFIEDCLSAFGQVQ